MNRYRRAALRDDAWYTLSNGPSRKHSPDHWYASVYWAGVAVGWRCQCLCLPVYRPVALAVMGFLRPWRSE